MAVSKAYLRRLGRVVKDRKVLAAIREFLVKHDDEINTNNLVITREGYMYYEGTIGKSTFYKKWGKYHWRKKSSLTTKRFRKDKVFQGSRESAERFALGNKLASKVYKMVDIEKKAYKLFCFLKKRAIELIKEGKNVDEAKEVLIDYLRSIDVVKDRKILNEDPGLLRTAGTVANAAAPLEVSEHPELSCGTGSEINFDNLNLPGIGMKVRPGPIQNPPLTVQRIRKGSGGRHRVIRTRLALTG